MEWMMGFVVGIYFGALGYYIFRLIFHKRGAWVQTFNLKVNGAPLTILAAKYEETDLWMRYIDDRGIELMRVPTCWKENLPAAPSEEPKP